MATGENSVVVDEQKALGDRRICDALRRGPHHEQVTLREELDAVGRLAPDAGKPWAVEDAAIGSEIR